MFLDTEDRWEDYCQKKGIENPFIYKLNGKLIPVEINGLKCYETHFIEEDYPPKEIIDSYVRLRDKFRMWDYHFWMTDWEVFKQSGNSKGYFPCDLAERQCSMACKYFGKKCPREVEELKCPIEGIEGRWKIS